MSIKILTAIAVAASVLSVSTFADAGSREGYNKRDYKAQHRNGRHGYKHRRHKRHFYFDVDYYGHDYFRSCNRLKRKARHTGSRYWWKRYHRCVARYGY